MLVLPDRPTRVMLSSFGIVLSVALGLAIALVALTLNVPHGWAWGPVGAASLAVASWRWPERISWFYHRWRGAAQTVVRYATFALAGICFLILSVAGRAGSQILWGKPRGPESGWVQKRALERNAYASESEFASLDLKRAAWVSRLFHWSRASGNRWALTLVPLLVVLSGIQRDPRGGGISETTYTLY